MINLHERMLPTSAGVEPATSWSPVGRRTKKKAIIKLRLIKSKGAGYLFEFFIRHSMASCLLEAHSEKPPTLKKNIYSLCGKIFSQTQLCFITKTRLYNVDPLKPHFYIEKLGFTGVYIIFLISAQNIDCVYSLEPPRPVGSSEYPQSMF